VLIGASIARRISISVQAVVNMDDLGARRQPNGIFLGQVPISLIAQEIGSAGVLRESLVVGAVIGPDLMGSRK
jgi:hypothetical protein